MVPKLASGKVNDWESLGLLSSPTIEDSRVYLVTTRCEVLCLTVEGMANGNHGPFKDEAKYVVKEVILDKGKPTERRAPPIPPGPKDADILWRYDIMDELGVFPHNASDGAPLVVGDSVYVNTSNGQDWTHSNIPSPNAPSLIAVNKFTGELAGGGRRRRRPAHFSRAVEFPLDRQRQRPAAHLLRRRRRRVLCLRPCAGEGRRHHFPQEGLVV